MAEPAFPLPLHRPADGRGWPAQGEWTFEDYLRLPEDGQRYEVIRGFLYVTPSPTFDHQFSVWQLVRLIGNFVVERGLGIVLPSPFDVLLPGGLATPVQPDLVFLRTGNQPRPGDRNFQGVPDLAVEVLSPATRRLDRSVKLAAYREAGVPEVWLVDPRARTVEVFAPDKGPREPAEGTTYRASQRVRSSVLAGLPLEVAALFPPRTE
jgi:Uma2 family endonuclease